MNALAAMPGVAIPNVALPNAALPNVGAAAAAAFRALAGADAVSRPARLTVRSVELAVALLFIVLALAVRGMPTRPGADPWRHTAVRSVRRWSARARVPSAAQWAQAVCAGLVAALVAGGSAAAPTGLAVAAAVLVVSSRRISERDVRAQHLLIAATPLAADLFAAGLAAGLMPADAAAVVAAAYDRSADTTGIRGGAAPIAHIASRFAAAAAALREGCDPEVAWRFLMVDAATAAIGAAALRSSRTGAPAALTVAKAARDSWSAAEQAAQAQIRAVGVRATAPLALCFLPAFVLVGVVPTALGLLAGIHP